MNALQTGIAIAGFVALLGAIGWSVQRIIGSIDQLRGDLHAQGEQTSDKLEELGTRVTIIETKQEATSANVRKTARKVGVLPRDIENTIDPRHPVRT